MFGDEKLESPVVAVDEAIAQFRDGSRFWIQRVAVPVITVIGMFGNTITIIIMTRRGMRSTINLYLAALAFCDMLYLVLTFLLGLEHYPNMANPEYYLYWKFKPYLMMSTDACSNTSVWLTVTFTIERYIAVRYPMKAKVWCTESRAKSLILSIFVFGILFATPVPFEWEVVKRYVITGNSQIKSFNNQTQLSIDNNNNKELMNVGNNQESPFVWALDYSDFGRNDMYKTIYYRSTAAIFYIIPLMSLIYFNSCLIHSVHQSRRERSEMTGRGGGGGGGGGGTIRKSTTSYNNSIPTPKVVVDSSITGSEDKKNNCNKLEVAKEENIIQDGQDVELDYNKDIAQSSKAKVYQTNLQNKPSVRETISSSDLTIGETSETNVQISCDNEPFIERSSKKDSVESNKIGKNYAEMISLNNKNGKLNFNNNNSNTDIKSLSTRSSPTKRFLRTKSTSQQAPGIPYATQERRITIMLICVVILFLFCQLPSAVMILYTATRELKANSNELALVLAFGNIFNFLMAINAAGNFVLYSLLSKKYRRTFVRLFCNCFRVKKKGNNKMQERNTKTFVRFEAVGHSIRNKAIHQINKSADKSRSDTLV